MVSLKEKSLQGDQQITHGSAQKQTQAILICVLTTKA
jgi:hypothetical protein